MSASIDERIVEMKFDNAEFERGVKTSLKTLKDLDDGLKMEEGSKSLSSLSNAIAGVSFAPLAAGIESVGHSFSAMEIAAMTVISRITDSVINMAKNITTQLVIDPVKTGLNEYEQKIDMVQTTVINSGKSLEEVNETLNELNHYADKTIFKFSDMTAALSKFTMSGITDLNLAQTMIEGIGNIAGESGLKTEQASSAFYMISQAISAGKMSLYQWRTLENTGFASMKFKQNLLETAEALGKIKKIGDGVYRAYTDKGKAIEVTAETLRNTLTETGWMDKEVMETIFARYASPEATEALNKAAKKDFEDISEAAYHAAQDVKTFSQMWDTLKEAAQSGWTESWEYIFGNYEEAKDLWGDVNEIISDILNDQATSRNDMLAEWKELDGRKYIIDGIFSSYKSLHQIISRIKNSFHTIFPRATGKDLADLSKKFLDLTESMKPSGMLLAKISTITINLSQIFKKLINYSKSVGTVVSETFREFFPKSDPTKVLGKVAEVFYNLNKVVSGESASNFSNLRRVLSGFFSAIEIGIEFVKAFYNFLYPIALNIIPKMAKGLSDGAAKIGDWILNIRNLVKEKDSFNNFFASITGGFEVMKNTVKTVTDYFKTIFGPSITLIKDTFKNAFKKEDTDETIGFFSFLKDIVTKTLSGLNTVIVKLVPVAKAIFDFFGKIITSITSGLSQFIDMAASNGIGRALNGIVAGFASLFALQSGWKITDFFGDIIQGFKALAEGFVSIVDDIKGIEELKDSVRFNLIVRALKEIAISMAILAVSFAVLSLIDWDKLATGFIVMTAGLVGIMKALKTMSGMTVDTGQLSRLTSNLIKISVSVLIMSAAMAILSKCEPERIGSSIVALGSIMVSLLAFSKFVSTNTKNFKTIAKALERIAIAVLILSVSLKLLSTIPTNELWSGVGAIGAIMTIMGLFAILVSKGVKKSSGLRNVGLMILEISVAMLIMSAAIKVLGGMELEELEKGIGGIAVLLLVFAVFAKMVQKSSIGILAAATSLLIIAAAISIMAIAIKVIGKTPKNEIIKGTVAITSILLALAIFSQIVKPVKVIALATAMAIFSASAIIFAIGLKALASMPLASLAKSLGALLLTLVAMGILASVLAPVLPAMFGLAAVLALIGISALAIGAGVLALSAGITGLSVSLAAFGGSLVVFLGEILSALPMVVDIIAALIIGIISAIAASTVSIVEAVVAIGVAVLDGLTELLPKLLDFVVLVFSEILDLVIELTPLAIDGLFRFIVALGKAIWPYLKDLWNNFIWPALKGLGSLIKTGWSLFKEAGMWLIQGLIDGFKEMWDGAVSAVTNLGKTIVAKLKGEFDEHSPSKVAYGIGAFFDIGLANGIKETSKQAVDAAGVMGESTVDMLKQVIGNISDVIEDDDYSPTITPVLDLTNVQAGTRSLGQMLSNQNGVSITAGISGRINSINGKPSLEDASDKQTVINNHYDMTQNNYSPKALSRIEIYRQTNNQFSRLKGVVSTV